jgi:hypothetical protein
MARARKDPEPADGPSCSECTHWHEQTEARDDVRWGNCHAEPPSVISDGDGGSICVVSWTELPYACRFHTPRTH